MRDQDAIEETEGHDSLRDCLQFYDRGRLTAEGIDHLSDEFFAVADGLIGEGFGICAD